ncbi:18375_t:CDS:1, partial [Racocetra persica]
CTIKNDFDQKFACKSFKEIHRMRTVFEPKISNTVWAKLTSNAT